jgi:hypothetical protein
MRKYIGTVAAIVFLTGCSNQELYNSQQGAKENECQKIVDANERSRCLEAAHESYDNYEKRRQESLKD